jgi:hypothetical protein
MSKARQIADLLDSGGDVQSGALDNMPASDWNTLLNKPTLAASATTDTTNASNISAGTINVARLGSSATAGKYLRGDGTWQSNCTNHGNCSNCSGTSTHTNCTNCSGTSTHTNCSNCSGTSTHTNCSNCSGTITAGTGTAGMGNQTPDGLSVLGHQLTTSGTNVVLSENNCNCVCNCNC